MILTINSHTGYHYLLSKIPNKFDVVGGWNHTNRPLPANLQLVEARDAIRKCIKQGYHAIIVHRQLHDLPWILLGLLFGIPVVLVFHGKKSRASKSWIAFSLLKNIYSNLIIRPLILVGRIKAVFIQPSVKESYGYRGVVIEPGIDPDDFLINDIVRSSSLPVIVGNNINRSHFDFSTVKRLLIQEKVNLIGQNSTVNSIKPGSFDSYKQYLASASCYLNLLEYPECGYNLATLEAAMCRTPIISLCHAESIIFNMWNGLTVDSPSEIESAIEFLRINPKISEEFVSKNYDFVANRFSLELFVSKWLSVLDVYDD